MYFRAGKPSRGSGIDMEIDALGRGLPILGCEPVARTADGIPPKTLINAVEAANRTELFGDDRELSFRRDDESRRLLIQIKDRRTGEVVQEIPPKALLEMLRNLQNAQTQRPNR